MSRSDRVNVDRLETEIARLTAETARLRGALITGASLLEMGCNHKDMAASMRRAAKPEPAP